MAVCGVVPVAATVPLLSAGTCWRHRGTTVGIGLIDTFFGPSPVAECYDRYNNLKYLSLELDHFERSIFKLARCVILGPRVFTY